MKKGIMIIAVLFLASCQEQCDCQYIKTESNPSNNYRWTQTYISTWDASCSNENLNSSTYTDSQGKQWYTKTEIKCK
jgi:hypothetical protein